MRQHSRLEPVVPQDPPDTMMDDNLLISALHVDSSHGKPAEYGLFLDARGRDAYERFIEERLTPRVELVAEVWVLFLDSFLSTFAFVSCALT